MLRKMVCLLSLFIVCMCSVSQIHALNTEELFIIKDEQRVRQIEELYALRSKLSMDYETNKEAIEKVSQQLAALGVEEMTYAEVASKFGITADPQVPVYQDDTIMWSTYRAINIYAGQFYELQIITGEPRNGVVLTPENCDLVSFTPIALKSNYGGTAAALEVLKAAAEETASDLRVIGDILSAGITVYELAAACGEAMSPTVSISGATASCSVTMHANEKFIFIKMQGAADSDQVCGYAGNYAQCAVTTTIPSWKDTNGDGKVDSGNIVLTCTDSITGPEYNNAYYIASKNLYDYRNGKWNFNSEYRMTVFGMTVFKNKDTGKGGVKVNVRIPLTEMSFLLPNAE